jgi:hypothetical protein
MNRRYFRVPLEVWKVLSCIFWVSPGSAWERVIPESKSKPESRPRSGGLFMAVSLHGDDRT